MDSDSDCGSYATIDPKRETILPTAFSTRNSSEDEIANVNFLYDDIVRALHNTIDSCMNSARDRRGCVGTQVYQS